MSKADSMWRMKTESKWQQREKQQNKSESLCGVWEGPLMKPGMRSKCFKVEHQSQPGSVFVCSHFLIQLCSSCSKLLTVLGFRLFSHQLLINWGTEQSPYCQLSQIPPWKSSEDGVIPTCSSDDCGVEQLGWRSDDFTHRLRLYPSFVLGVSCWITWTDSCLSCSKEQDSGARGEMRLSRRSSPFWHEWHPLSMHSHFEVLGWKQQMNKNRAPTLCEAYRCTTVEILHFTHFLLSFLFCCSTKQSN